MERKMTEKEPPKRKIQVTIKINADDFESLRQEFNNIYYEKIREDNYISSCVTGGVSSSYYYGCIITSEQTAENYQRELAEYIKDKEK
jgi:uncharacterized protein CbrC (UPF0167 family)